MTIGVSRFSNSRSVTVVTGTLTRIGNITALTALNDIVGRPVIDRDMVIAVNQSGQFAAFNLVNGEIVWSQL